MLTTLPFLSARTVYDGTLVEQARAVERAIHIMHTHLHEPLSLEDLASIACLSPSHFHRVFRRHIGIPPGEFLLALRFQTARKLLLTTPLSVTDICFEVGYNSIGSFTTHFTQRVGLSPRLLRQRAHAFEPLPVEDAGSLSTIPSNMPGKKTLRGLISASTSFRGTIYIGLFTSPIPQGAPVRCTSLSSPGQYQIHNIADGVYHLRAAAFPIASDLQSSLLPGEKLLVGNNADAIVVHHGHVVGNPNLDLHTPRLTDPPLVMGLPLV